MERQTSYHEVPVSQPVELNSKVYRPTWKNSYTQIIGAGLVHLLTIQAGINMAYSAILLPQLNSTDSEIKLQDGEGAWIASLVTISLPVGSLLSGPLMDNYGRRNVSLFLCVPYMVSWILIYWSYNVVWLYVGRILAGTAGGISSVSIYYTSETANPLWRPMLLGLNSVFVSFGILLTAVFGMWFDWRAVAVIFAILTTLIFILVTILPESPHWLLAFKNGTQDMHRVTEARKALRWLYKDECQAEKELNQLLATYRAGSIGFIKRSETLKEKWETLKAPEIYKPIILLLFLFLFQQCSGSYVIIFYAVEMFKELGDSFGGLNAYGAMVLMGLIRFVMAIVTLFLLKRFGRRTLCMISGFGMAASMLGASICMQLNPTANKIPTLLLVLSFVCCSAIGWQTIPWSLTGELLPTRVRALVGGIMIAYTYFIMFIVVLTFPDLKELIYPKGVFAMFSIFSFSSTIFVWKYLPETFGKSLEEIEQFFK